MRSDVAVGAADSNKGAARRTPLIESQEVSGEHSRSENAVGATDSKVPSALLQALAAVHTRSEVAVGAEDSNSVARQGVSEEHSRFAVAVGATLSY
jgi:hypothetical protein